MKTFSQNGVSLWHRLPAEETKVWSLWHCPVGMKPPSGFGLTCQPWCRERFLFFSSAVQNWISGSKYARTHYNPVVKSMPSCPVVGLLGSLRGTSKVHLWRSTSFWLPELWAGCSEGAGWDDHTTWIWKFNILFLRSLYYFLAHPSTSKFTL